LRKWRRFDLAVKPHQRFVICVHLVTWDVSRWYFQKLVAFSGNWIIFQMDCDKYRAVPKIILAHLHTGPFGS
jgi:hypothetical protein